MSAEAGAISVVEVPRCTIRRGSDQPMADVFLSYTRKDRTRAETFAKLIASRGWTVWWDRKLQVGRSFSRIIQQELEAARCVIVLWSKDSVESEWVLNEAAEGARRNILIPIRIQNIRPPLQFRHLHVADVFDTSDEASQAMEDCLEAISAIVPPGSASIPHQVAETPNLKLQQHRNEPLYIHTPVAGTLQVETTHEATGPLLPVAHPRSVIAPLALVAGLAITITAWLLLPLLKDSSPGAPMATRAAGPPLYVTPEMIVHCETRATPENEGTCSPPRSSVQLGRVIHKRGVIFTLPTPATAYAAVRVPRGVSAVSFMVGNYKSGSACTGQVPTRMAILVDGVVRWTGTAGTVPLFERVILPEDSSWIVFRGESGDGDPKCDDSVWADVALENN